MGNDAGVWGTVAAIGMAALAIGRAAARASRRRQREAERRQRAQTAPPERRGRVLPPLPPEPPNAVRDRRHPREPFAVNRPPDGEPPAPKAPSPTPHQAGHPVDPAALADALDLIAATRLGSAGLIARRLPTDTATAARIMLRLEQLGAVGPSDGKHARDVLLTGQQLAELAERLRSSRG